MNRVTIDATEDEISLLEALWEMASASHEFVNPGVLPGRAVVCRWSEIYRAWRLEPPQLAGLQAARESLATLAAREIRIDGAPADFDAERIIDVQILSRDHAGTEDVRLLINLSGYTPLVLEDHQLRD